MDNPSDAIKKIPDFEFEKNLFKFQIRNVNVWDFIRFEVSYLIVGKLSEDINSTDFSISNKKFIARFKELLLAMFYLPHTILLILRQYKRVDIVIFNKGSYSLIEDKLVDTHSYYLASTLIKEKKILILDHNHYPKNPLNYNYSVNCIGTKSLHVLSRVFSYFYTLDKKEVAIIETISSLLEREFKVSIDLNSVIKNNFFYQLVLSRVYKTIFYTFGNNQIICVDNGNYKGIFYSAKKSKITVFDYQHSLLSELYILYHYHKDVDIKDIRDSIPDKILTWSSYWHNLIQIPAEKKVIGFKYFDLSKKEYISGSEDPDYSKNIYFISPTIKQQKIDLYMIASIIAEELKGYKIYFKLRSEDYKNIDLIFPISNKKSNQPIFIDDRDEHIYYRLSKCKFVVGINSTLFIEAISLGAFPFVYKADFHKDMKILSDDFNSIIFNTTQELMKKIINFNGRNVIYRHKFFTRYNEDTTRAVIINSS